MGDQVDWMPDIQAMPKSSLWCDGNPGTDPQKWDRQEWPDAQECEDTGTHVLDDLVLCDKDAQWFRDAGFFPRPVRPSRV